MAGASLEEGPMDLTFLNNSWTRRLSSELLAEVQIGRTTHLPALSLPWSMTSTSVSNVQSPSNTRSNSNRPGSSANRYTPIGTLAGNDLGKSLAYVPPISAKDCLEELKEVLLKPLEKVSRQRLRAILYGFRRKGGLENRVSVQHLNNVLLEHEVHLSSRIIMLIRKSYEDKWGVDYEALWKLMCISQALTGRDSVICMHGTDGLRNGRKESVSGTGIDPRDRELISRLKHEFMSSREHNLTEIRDQCEERDTLRHGLLQSRVLQKICEEQRLPVSKPLLSLLLARCDDEKNGHISWTDFMGLLEKAYAELPEMPVPVQRPQPVKSESTVSVNDQLPAIVEKSGKAESGRAEKVPSNKRKVVPKSSKKGRRQATTPPRRTPPNTQTEGDLSNEEMGPRSESSASMVSKDSSGGESTFPSESLGEFAKEDGGGVEQSGDLEKQGKDEVLQRAVTEESTTTGSDQMEGEKKAPPSKPSNNKVKRPPSRAKSKADVIGKMQPLSCIAGKLKAKVNKKTNVTRHESSVDEGDSTDGKNGNEDERQDGDTTGKDSDMKAIEDVEKENDMTDTDGTDVSLRGDGNGRDGTVQVSGEVKSQQAEDTSPPDGNEEDKVTADKGEDDKVQEVEMALNEDTGNSAGKEHGTVEYIAGGQTLKFYKPDVYEGVTGPTKPPDKTLKLDWVYGYQGRNCRNNLYALASGELVYFSAHIVMLYDPVEHKQRHYLGHQSTVQSLAIHINGSTVASGQSESDSAQACVHIWYGSSLQTLLILGAGVFKNGVTCLDFAASHGYFLALDASSNPVLSVWDWKNSLQFASAPVGTDTVRQVRFQPKDPSVLVSVGKDHLVFWSLDKEGGKLEETTKPNFERNKQAKYINCVTFRPNGDVVTGDSNGTVYIWPRKSNTISLALPNIHEGPVHALRFLRGLLLTGGRDGRVFAWNLGSRGAKEMCCNKLGPDAGGAQTLAVAGSRIFVGTTTNFVHSLSISPSGPPFESAAKMDVVTQGHYEEVSGITPLTTPPFRGHFITVGHDGGIALVDSSDHRHLWRYSCGGLTLGCVDFSEGLLAVGTSKPSLLLCSLNMAGCEVLTQLEVPSHGGGGASHIRCVKFSPDGKWLAAGDGTGTVHFFEVGLAGKQLKRSKHLQGHQGSVRSLDWSVDGQFLRTSGDKGELFVWHTQSYEKQDPLDVRNSLWASHQALHGFYCKGLWEQDDASPGDVDVLYIEEEGTRLMVAAEDGRMDIHHYPSMQADQRTSVPVISGVSRARFLSGSHLVSVGGSSTIQWSLCDGPNF